MKGSAPRQNSAAADATIARRPSRWHLRLIQPDQPLTASLGCDEDAHELPTQRIEHDVDPDDPPFTVLAW
ncbi:MAG TPA: hypothetical protein VLZ05_06085 [Mycobacterium sp.]|nr:hypothetical protein [Mycobacterium sp.]HUH68475.1 hypothetical protein [Mycobacterium sp.]